ncbi:MAG: HEAT repeat domain-containing protein [Anaerolineae bacterium]
MSDHITRLQTGDTRARMQSARALGTLGDESALPVLEQALQDESVAVVRSATLALGHIGGCAVLATLLRLLTHEQVWVRKASVEALGLSGCAEAVPILVNQLAEPNSHALAREALIRLNVDPDFF